jgi:DNA-binding IclR family transcriptional regulator
MTSNPGIQSVEKAFEVLQAIMAGGGPTRLADIARSTGLARNLAYAYLVSLRRVGAVVQDPETGRYDLGETALRFGLAALSRLDFLAVARGVMKELHQEVGESVWLSVWGEHGPVVVANVEGANASPFGVRIGSVVNLSVTATGRTFISYLDPKIWRPLLKEERARLGSAAAREAEINRYIAAIRRIGLSVRPQVGASASAVLSQFSAVAAPVFDHTGAIKAALTVIGQAPMFDASADGPNATALKAAAARLSARLGYATKAAA